MSNEVVPPQAAIRALPYVAGVSRRVKAEPTKLSALSAKMMSASGTFSTRRGGASFPFGRIAGAMAVLAMAGAVVLGGDRSSVDAQTQAADARVIQSDEFFKLGLGDYSHRPAIEQRSEMMNDPLESVDGQNRFEIGRFVRPR